MGYLDGIIKAAAVLGALGVIFGVGVKAWRFIVKAWRFIVKLDGRIKALNDTLTALQNHSHENYMGILRLTIMANEMPIGERIVAGHKYLNEGGNGEVKSFLKDKFNIEETIEEAEHYKK